ncbi:MAG TPA: hypothetical protein VFB62_20400, partial [Polyangiaceae bacterium]|nr:hypothetical protein [Polyangiaceae bacterium]
MSVIASDCVARVSAAMGEKLKKGDIEEAAGELDRLARELVGEGLSPGDAVVAAARRYAEKAELAAVIATRNANINAIRFTELLGYVREVWKGNEAEGIRALLTGSIEGRRGARLSVAREQKVLEGQYFGQITTELERAGVMDAFKTGSLDLEVSRALWQLNEKVPRLEGLSKDAVTVAKIVHKAQEVARADANRAGAWIGKAAGWITRQSHDPWKLVKSGQQGWISAIAPRLDWARMEAQHGPIPNKIEWLAKTWQNLTTGVHLKAPGAETNTG